MPCATSANIAARTADTAPRGWFATRAAHSPTDRLSVMQSFNRACMTLTVTPLGGGHPQKQCSNSDPSDAAIVVHRCTFEWQNPV